MDTSTKIEFTKPIDKQTFQTTISIPIDSSVNIKNLLSVDAYTYDEKLECGNAKAIYSGKIGVKILYIDTDNVTNTLSTNQTISETFLDGAFTSDCFVITSSSVNTNVLSTDGTLKLVCDVTVSPTLYVNLPMPSSVESFNNMIIKKEELNLASIKSNVQTSFEYTTNMETRDVVEKILCYNSYFIPLKITPCENSVVIEGKIYSKIVYETNENDLHIIKELCDVFNTKNELTLDGCSPESMLDLCLNIDHSKTQISTENEDDENVITIQHTIVVNGIMSNMLTIETCDDVYSVENEIDVSTTNREYCSSIETSSEECTILGEVSVGDNEPAIDDIVANLNACVEITKSFVKSDSLFIEGIITSQVLYLNENKEYSTKNAQVPFSVDTKIPAQDATVKYVSPYILDCKVKSKRGTTIELEYNLIVLCNSYHYDNKTMIDNIIIGKPLDFSQYDYQIFLAKPDETKWDLAKRIKISPENLEKCNKSLPDIMQGGEKVIIKR